MDIGVAMLLIATFIFAGILTTVLLVLSWAVRSRKTRQAGPSLSGHRKLRPSLHLIEERRFEPSWSQPADLNPAASLVVLQSAALREEAISAALNNRRPRDVGEPRDSTAAREEPLVAGTPLYAWAPAAMAALIFLPAVIAAIDWWRTNVANRIPPGDDKG